MRKMAMTICPWAAEVTAFDGALLRHVGCGDARDHRKRMGLSPPADYEARIAEIVDAYCERALVAFADIHQSLEGIDFAPLMTT
jgi:hypothetical protein